MGNLGKKPMIVIMGATATGKSKIAVDVAKKYAAEIVSADSMLVYKGMDICTAKPTILERGDIPHYMIDVVEPSYSYSVAEYAEKATEICLDIIARGRMPVVVGGTGQYIDAVAFGERYLPNQCDAEYRAVLEKAYSENGSQYIYKILLEKDPKLALNIHTNNVRRVIRALEKIYIAEKCGASGSTDTRYVEENFSFSPFVIGLAYRDRQRHREIIEMRVDNMLKDGLLDEVKGLLKVSLSKTAAQAIGYKELQSFFEGDISLEEAVCAIKQATARYAKRQRTWFSKYKSANWYYVDDYGSYTEILEAATKGIEKYFTEGGFLL